MNHFTKYGDMSVHPTTLTISVKWAYFASLAQAKLLLEDASAAQMPQMRPASMNQVNGGPSSSSTYAPPTVATGLSWRFPAHALLVSLI